MATLRFSHCRTCSASRLRRCCVHLCRCRCRVDIVIPHPQDLRGARPDPSGRTPCYVARLLRSRAGSPGRERESDRE
eukprot:897821-Prorocentrum_minimum.AAC.10